MLDRVLNISIWQISEYVSSFEIAGLQRVLSKFYSKDSQYSEYDSGSRYTKILNVSGFLTCCSLTGYIDRVLNIAYVLNMLGL